MTSLFYLHCPNLIQELPESWSTGRQSRKRPIVSFGLFQVDFKNAKGQSIGLDRRLTQLNRSRGTGDWGMICTAIIAEKVQPLPAALARAAQLRATADFSCFNIAFGDSTNYHHSNQELGQKSGLPTPLSGCIFSTLHVNMCMFHLPTPNPIPSPLRP